MELKNLTQKADDFIKRNEIISWTPHDFPEDMEDDDIFDTIISEGNVIYDELCEAKELISKLISIKVR